MITKAAAPSNGTKQDVKYLALIERDLAEIKAIQNEIARERGRGRNVTAAIDRTLTEIQAIIDRVEATL